MTKIDSIGQPDHAGVHPATKAIPADKFTSGDLMHAQNSAGANIARAGGKAKRHLGEAPEVHSGMHHQESGVGVHGISKTQNAAEAPDASSANPLDKTYEGKVLPIPVTTPGMRSRTDAGMQHTDYRHAVGKRVLDEAILSGSSKLPEPK
jgi:hypothetical protein